MILANNENNQKNQLGSLPRQIKLDPIIIFPLTMLALGIILVYVFLPKIAYFFHDDSFFYIKTAYNISRGLGSTFDGINLTNGYHPLYMGLLSVLSYIFPLLGNQGLLIIFILDMCLMAVTLIIINVFINRLGLTSLSRLIVLTFLAFGLSFSDFAMEARLLLPLVWLLLLLIFSLESYKKQHLVLFSILGALITLTRTDTFLFVALTFFYLSFSQYLSPHPSKLSSCLKQFIALFSPTAIVLAAYALYNQLVFSFPTSISSHLKLGFPGTFESGWFGRSVPGLKARFMLVFVIALIFFIYAYKNKFLRKQGQTSFKLNLLFLTLNIYNVIYLFIMLLFLRDGPGSWYLALPLSIAAVSGIYLFEEFATILSNTAKVRLQVLLFLLVTLAGMLFVYGKFTYPPNIELKDEQVNMSLWIKKNLPLDSRIYQVDASGVIGYFSERAVINGDGLINGWEYQRYLRQNALKEYFQKNNINYIVCFEAEPPINVLTWDTKPKKLTFSKSPQQLIQFGNFILLKIDPQYVITK